VFGFSAAIFGRRWKVRPVTWGARGVDFFYGAAWQIFSAEPSWCVSSVLLQELNPWCFLTLGMIVLALALAAHLQSLTFLTLGVILLSHMRWRARIADGGGTRSSCSGTCGASHLR